MIGWTGALALLLPLALDWSFVAMGSLPAIVVIGWIISRGLRNRR